MRRGDRGKYYEAKHMAKKAISKAQEVERRKFGEKLDEESEKRTIFRVAKQIVIIWAAGNRKAFNRANYL